MRLEIIIKDGKIILRVKEDSGKYLDLIMSQDEVHQLVHRLMSAASNIER